MNRNKMINEIVNNNSLYRLCDLNVSSNERVREVYDLICGRNYRYILTVRNRYESTEFIVKSKKPISMELLQAAALIMDDGVSGGKTKSIVETIEQ